MLKFRQVIINEKNEELNQQNEEILAQRDQIEKQRDLLEQQNRTNKSSWEFYSSIPFKSAGE